MVHRFPQLARKIGQLGKVQGVETKSKSRVPSMPHSKENKVVESMQPVGEDGKILDLFH